MVPTERAPVPVRLTSATPGRIRFVLEDRSGRAARSRALERISAQLREQLPGADATTNPVTGSLVLAYPKRLYPLRRVRELIATLLAGPTAAGGGTSLSPDLSRVNRADTPGPVEMAHSIRGRLRVRVARLERFPEAAAYLQCRLSYLDGVRKVRVSGDSVVLEYEPGSHSAGDLAATVSHTLGEAVETIPDRGRSFSGREKQPDGRKGLKPLVFPTVALALTAAEASPPLVAAALLMATVPIARRALRGVRERRFRMAQMDLIGLALLTAAGDLGTAGLATWIIGAGEALIDRTVHRIRDAVAVPLSPSGLKAWRDDGVLSRISGEQLVRGDRIRLYPGMQLPVDGRLSEGAVIVDERLITGCREPVSRRHGDPLLALSRIVAGRGVLTTERAQRDSRAAQVGDRLLQAPLENTRGQRWAESLGGKLLVPIVGIAALDLALSGNARRANGVLKYLDVASGLLVSAPLAVLSALSAGVREGILIQGGAALEQLAKIDTLLLLVPARAKGAGNQAALADALAARGIRMVPADQHAADALREQIRELRAGGHTVAVLGGNGIPFGAQEAEGKICFWDPGTAPNREATALLLDDRWENVPRAIDLARGAVRLLEQDMQITAWPNAVALAATALGISPPLTSTLVNNSVTVAAALNSLRPLLMAMDEGRPSARLVSGPAGAETKRMALPAGWSC